jgi:hypothetical protein
MAALNTLETPSPSPVPPEPTAPAQELAPPLDATQTAIQAEIARQVDRKVALALQEYFASQASGEIQGRRSRTKKSRSVSGSKKEEAVFSRQQNPTNVIAFPTRMA